MNVVTIVLDSFWVGFFAGVVFLMFVGYLLSVKQRKDLEKAELRRIEAARSAVENAVKKSRRRPE